MTSIGSIISPTVAAAMRMAVTMTEDDIAAAIAEPDEVRVTFINGVEYDVRSEAMAQTTCSDCPASLLVNVVPEGLDVEEVVDVQRRATCKECGRKRAVGKSGTIIHQQKGPIIDIDLTKFSEAEIAQLAIQARARMVAEAEALIPGKRAEAQAAEAERVATDDVLKGEQRESNRNLDLPDLTITVKGQTKFVPALDLSEMGNDLNVETTPLLRRPYNKALYALGMDTLPKDSTYVAVVEAHTMLMEHGTTPVEALATVVEPDAKAKVTKVAAYAQVMGISEKKARKRLEKVGIL